MLSGLVVLLVLAVAGCASGTASPAAPADGSGSGAASGAETVDLEFSARTLAGEPFEGASLADAPTVLWFWAPWCPTCRSQMSTVSGLGRKYDGRVNVVGVGGLDTQEAIEELAGTIEDITHLVDDEGEVWKHFGVTAQSTYTVVDAGGAIVHEGYLDNGALDDLVASLAG